MQIFCIVVYKKKACTLPLLALPNNFILEKHVKLIQQKWPTIADKIENITGIRKIILHEGVFKLENNEDYNVTSNEYFYAFITPTNNIILALNQPINLHLQLALYRAIQAAGVDTPQLEWILGHPHEAILTKIDEIKADLNETKEIMLENIDKIIARGEKIESLLERTEIMQTESYKFKKASQKLNSNFLCPGLFFFINGIRSWFKKPNLEHDFQPIDKKSKLWGLL